MNELFFLAGLAVGFVFFGVYTYYVRRRWNEKNIKERQIFQLVENSRDIIYIAKIKPEPKHVYISPALDFYLGKGVVEKSMEDSMYPYQLIHPEDKEILDRKLTKQMDYSKPILQRWKDNLGRYRCFEEYITPIYDVNEELVEIQGIMRNIDEKIQLQQNLEYRSTHDGLTKLFNRDYFDQVMEKYNSEVNISIGMIICDLDQLKQTNDHFGHKKGDLLIEESAKLLRRATPKGAMLFRIGGDEFVVLLPNIEESEVEIVNERIQKECRICTIKQLGMSLRISLGYAHSAHSLGEMEAIFNEADQYMYHHKYAKRKLHTNV